MQQKRPRENIYQLMYLLSESKKMINSCHAEPRNTITYKYV